MTRFFTGFLIAVLLAGMAWAQPAHTVRPAPGDACGPLSGQVFKCLKFGFIYTVPFAWVDRTAEMNPEADNANANGQPPTSETLLAVFERPPEAAGETINSAVVIAAESLKDYRGVKTAADYFGPITELAEQRGFKTVNDPYEFKVSAKSLVRADYSKPRGSLTMFQSTLAMIEREEIVSFTFIGGSKDEVDGLISSLYFTPGHARKSADHGPK